MVLNPAYFGTVNHQNTMIHEMGHILGLYHVFKGVSERESCDDPCQVSVFSGHSCDIYSIFLIHGGFISNSLIVQQNKQTKKDFHLLFVISSVKSMHASKS